MSSACGCQKSRSLEGYNPFKSRFSESIKSLRHKRSCWIARKRPREYRTE